VTVMLLKIPGLMRSPDQTGRTEDRSRRMEVLRRGVSSHKCGGGRLPMFNETGNPKARPGLAERDMVVGHYRGTDSLDAEARQSQTECNRHRRK